MLFVVLFVLAFGSAHAIDFPTPLQQYVAAPDPTYRYEYVSKVPGVDTMTYNIHLFSQTWLSAELTSISVWDHWLQIIVPYNFDGSTQSGIYVDGNGQSTTPPSGEDLLGIMIAQQTRSVIGHLYQIPNEPATFSGEGNRHRRSEDAVIAYTWSHYINDTSTPQWLLRLPMVKGVVRAMDVMQDFLPKIGLVQPVNFMIAGASKRGWTTWLLPAVDSRVNAIVPMVMPILNMRDVINQMWRSLGEWSFALGDYLEMDLMAYLNTGGLQAIADVIDPVVYMKYLAPIPKYMIFSCGDEFFLPDSTRNFMDDLQGNHYLRMAPNAEHSLAPLDAIIVNNIATFVLYVKHNDTIPSITETIVYSNTSASISVMPSRPPTQARLYQATTIQNVRRDFRLIICTTFPECFQPVFWTYTFLKPNADGSYSATVQAPGDVYGWTAFLIELSYETPYEPAGQQWFQVSSRVVIVPDMYPFPSCGLNCGNNATTSASSSASSASSDSSDSSSEPQYCSSLLSPRHRCLPPLPPHLNEPKEN